MFLYYFQARKLEELGKIDFDEELKKRTKIVYVPNWFNVDLKTGVIFLLMSKRLSRSLFCHGW